MSTAGTHQDVSTVLAREPCAGCGAPLGADQRYCLACGVPRASTRLPFLDVLHAEATAAHPLRAPALAPLATTQYAGGDSGWTGRLRENSGVLALAGVLLLALLIGLLLGHWVAGGSSRGVASVPQTQVIKYEGTPPVAAAAAPAATQAEGVGASTAAGSSSSGSSTPASAGTSTSASATTAHAANPTVDKLAQSTGKAHAKAVEEAIGKGKSLSTGGPPPPKETNKPAGGGSGFQTIE